jgi:hypothetical protein
MSDGAEGLNMHKFNLLLSRTCFPLLKITFHALNQVLLIILKLRSRTITWTKVHSFAACDSFKD